MKLALMLSDADIFLQKDIWQITTTYHMANSHIRKVYLDLIYQVFS